MDEHSPPGFEDPGTASLWSWLFGRREAPAARVRTPVAQRPWGRAAGAALAQATARRPAAAGPGRTSGLTVAWDASVGAVRALVTVRPDLVDPRAVRAELDGSWRAMLRAIDPQQDGRGVPPSAPVVVTVRISDRQLGDEARYFLDGVRANPGSERIRAVEVQRVQPSAPTWGR